MPHHVFVTGGSGYLGRPLLELLRARGHTVRALVRAGGDTRIPPGVPVVTGDPLSPESVARELAPSDTLVHLVGTRHPGPGMTTEFQRVDGRSAIASLEAALATGVRHLIYVSVAYPAPVMAAYIEVRRGVEQRIREAHRTAGLHATILRPWYVLGPGHRWPSLFVPFYAIARRMPSLRASAQRLGLVTRDQMLGALVYAVEHPSPGVSSLNVPAIRAVGRHLRAE